MSSFELILRVHPISIWVDIVHRFRVLFTIYFHPHSSNILYSDKMGYKIQLRLFPKIDFLEFVKKYTVQYIFYEI
jgi:hypothetical protein